MSCGSGTRLGEYALKGFRDFGISSDTAAFFSGVRDLVVVSEFADAEFVCGDTGVPLICDAPLGRANPGLYCAAIEVVKQTIRRDASNFFPSPERRLLVIASPPHTAAAPDLRCR